MGKRDKAKVELEEVMAQTLKLQQALGRLEQEQMMLQLKHELLLRIIDGLGVISSCLAEFKKAHVTHVIGPGSHQRLVEDLKQQEQMIAQALKMFNYTRQHPGNTLLHQGSIDMMHHIFQPANVLKVLAMPLEHIMARLRTLAGKCAILVFQGRAVSCRDEMRAESRAHTAAAADSVAKAPTAYDNDCSTRSGNSEQQQQQQQQQQLAVSSFICHPGVEFTFIVMTIMLWDAERFPVLLSSNLETGEPYLQLPAGSWQRVANQLQLTTEQQLMFNILHQRFLGGMTRAYQKVGVASQQQAAMSEQLQQHCQLQQRHWPGVELPSKEVKQLQEKQADLLEAQCGMLREVKMMGLYMGIAAMTTLTTFQHAVFIAASFPCIPRMDLLLAAIEERVQQEQQVQQQQAAEAAPVLQ